MVEYEIPRSKKEGVDSRSKTEIKRLIGALRRKFGIGSKEGEDK